LNGIRLPTQLSGSRASWASGRQQVEHVRIEDALALRTLRPAVVLDHDASRAVYRDERHAVLTAVELEGRDLA
jgi:hypothetical protein